MTSVEVRSACWPGADLADDRMRALDQYCSESPGRCASPARCWTVTRTRSAGSCDLAAVRYVPGVLRAAASTAPAT